MAENPLKALFKLSDIKGPYPLLGAFLLIVESLLGLWLFRATGSLERTIAGLIMVSLLAAFLYTVMRMQKEPTEVPTSPGLGKVTAATEVATREEIETPEPQKLAGPDRTYVINKPPANWIIKELTLNEFMRERMEMTLPVEEDNAPREILVFKAPTESEVVPQPGKTTYEGRIFPKALTATIPVQLAILPRERYSSPFFVERALEHNFVTFIGETASGGLSLKSLRSGILPNSQIKYLQAEFSQEIGNASVNGKPGVDVILNAIVMGIQGELRDHLLILNYPSLPHSFDPALDQDLKDLLELANSFKPLELTNSVATRKEIEQKKDQEYKEFLEQNKEGLFYGEFALAILRFNETDMENPARRADAIDVLKPFEASAKELDFHDMDNLWEVLHKAESGDATDFKSLFITLRQQVLSGMKGGNPPGEEAPPQIESPKAIETGAGLGPA